MGVPETGVTKVWPAKLLQSSTRAGENDGPFRAMKNVFAKPSQRALASRADLSFVLAGKENVVARSDHFVQIHAADQRLALAERMRPLRASADDLLGNVLNIGQRLRIAVRVTLADRRIFLIVALRVAVNAQRERVIAELLIEAARAFADLRVVGLNQRCRCGEIR